MLVVLSPAKTLTIDAISTKAAKGTPRFAAQADALVNAVLSKLSPAALAKLCEVSPALGQLNHARFQAWNSRDNPRAAAALAFDGPAFKALGARSMSSELLSRVDASVRCLSGLYGLLRPTDAIQPYRLCMGTKIGTPEAKDLYSFWGERVAQARVREGGALARQRHRGGPGPGRGWSSAGGDARLFRAAQRWWCRRRRRRAAAAAALARTLGPAAAPPPR